MIRLPPRSTRTTHSFPTRRSSDLPPAAAPDPHHKLVSGLDVYFGMMRADALRSQGAMASGSKLSIPRSEEHTSELQSLMRISYAVFCLKKKHNTLETH